MVDREKIKDVLRAQFQTETAESGNKILSASLSIEQIDSMADQILARLNNVPKGKPLLLSVDKLAEALRDRFLGAEENRPIRARAWIQEHKREIDFLIQAQREADIKFYS